MPVIIFSYVTTRNNYNLFLFIHLLILSNVMNTQIKSGFTIITDNKTLKMLSDAGKIEWPVMTNNSKGIKFKYVNEVDAIGWMFGHKNRHYQLRYHSGCFYPYVYEIFGK